MARATKVRKGHGIDLKATEPLVDNALGVLCVFSFHFWIKLQFRRPNEVLDMPLRGGVLCLRACSKYQNIWPSPLLDKGLTILFVWCIVDLVEMILLHWCPLKILILPPVWNVVSF